MIRNVNSLEKKEYGMWHLLLGESQTMLGKFRLSVKKVTLG